MLFDYKILVMVFNMLFTFPFNVRFFFFTGLQFFFFFLFVNYDIDKCLKSFF